jgi:LuxR family transcriptional regulator, quorum-sensing system regulator SolR
LEDWQPDLAEKFARCDSEDFLMQLLVETCTELGFEYFAFGIRSPLPLSKPRIVVLNNYPIEWQKRYADKQYVASDPSIGKALRSNSAVVWSDRLFVENPELWREAQSFRLKVGCAQSHADGAGMQSLLSLARSGEVLTDKELTAKAHRIKWLTNLLHQSFLQRLASTLMPDAEVQLVEREIEVLRWTAEGKTSSDIAEILNLSERTVNFHLNNASSKLGTCNKTAASVKAALLGLIW